MCGGEITESLFQMECLFIQRIQHKPLRKKEHVNRFVRKAFFYQRVPRLTLGRIVPKHDEYLNQSTDTPEDQLVGTER